jgi:hypothetical protein
VAGASPPGRSRLVILERLGRRLFFGVGGEIHCLSLDPHSRPVLAAQCVDIGEQGQIVVLGCGVVLYGLFGALQGEIEVSEVRGRLLEIDDNPGGEDEQGLLVVSLRTGDEGVGDRLCSLAVLEPHEGDFVLPPPVD